MGQAEQRLGRQAVPGNRKFPDGRELTWQQIGIKGLIADPQVPYLLRWDDGTEDLHPSRALDPVGFIDEITIAGSRDRVLEWLGKPDEVQLGEVTMSYQSPNGTPGILSVTFQTPKARSCCSQGRKDQGQGVNRERSPPAPGPLTRRRRGAKAGRTAQPPIPIAGPISAKPTKPTASSRKCAITSGITRPHRRYTQPNTAPITALPMNGPNPWYRW